MIDREQAWNDLVALPSKLEQTQSKLSTIKTEIEGKIVKWEKRTEAYVGQLGIANRVSYEVIDDLKSILKLMEE